MLYIEATPEDTEAYLSRSELARRGWTDSMIAALLAAPDRLRPNPVIPGRGPMRMYALSRVAALEGGEEFATLRLLAEHRRSQLRRRRDEARALVRAEIGAATLAVPRHTPEGLVAAACEHERSRAPGERELERWQVDYLVDRLPGLAGLRLSPVAAAVVGPGGALRKEAAALLRRRQAEAIAAAYPWLTEAAHRRLRVSGRDHPQARAEPEEAPPRRAGPREDGRERGGPAGAASLRRAPGDSLVDAEASPSSPDPEFDDVGCLGMAGDPADPDGGGDGAVRGDRAGGPGGDGAVRGDRAEGAVRGDRAGGPGGDGAARGDRGGGSGGGDAGAETEGNAGGAPSPGGAAPVRRSGAEVVVKPMEDAA